MRRTRLLWQLYPSYLLVTVLSLLAVTWYASSAVRDFYLDQTARALESHARILERSLPSNPAAVDAFCKQAAKLAAGMRITVIQPSGKVIGDSDADPAAMENHADRPEVQAAFTGGYGRVVRKSPTLGLPMMYVAVLSRNSPENRVVRAAFSLSHIDQTVHELQARVALAGVAIAIAAAMICLIVSGRVARPIEEMKRGVQRLAAGELGHRIHVPLSEELGSLAEVINEMAAQAEDRIRLITAQRNEQEAVFSSMVEGILAVDMRERVLRMNQAAGELLRVQPASAQGKTIPEVVRNPDLQKFVAAALSSPAPTEGEVVLRNGGERWLQAHGAALNDASGSRVGAVIALNDVTRIRRLEGFRRDFVANVSHELRTPITCIKGFVETLLDGAVAEPKAAENFLKIIARQADRLNAILNDLLLLSKLEEQERKESLTTEEAALRDVLDTAVQLCAPKAEGKRIAINVRCEEGLRAKFNVALLEQAVVNLVDNAVKYSEPGKSVYVEALRRDGAIVIRVRDEGCGIGEEHLPRIFERFYRVDKGRSREMGGTGLGLSIVKHIAQAHGGTLAVESTLGKGSLFTLTLPSR